jgi:periplasmic divalent cation tolerance protein
VRRRLGLGLVHDWTVAAAQRLYGSAATKAITKILADRGEAERLARLAVESRLAAAVHVIGPVHSSYRWKGVVHEEQEWLCVARTVQARFRQLADLIIAEHPYEVPEISAVPIAHGSPAYLDWIAQETGGSSRSERVR